MILVPKTRYERLSLNDKEYHDKVGYYTTLLRDNGINFTEPQQSSELSNTTPVIEDGPSAEGVKKEKSQPIRKDSVNSVGGDGGGDGGDGDAADNDKQRNKKKKYTPSTYPSPMSINEQLPTKYRLYGKRLLEYIKKYGKNILGWNDKGMVIYQGSVISKSDIIVLIKYIFKGKGDQPHGLKDFRRGLKEIRTPKVFLKPFLLQPPGIPNNIKKNWRKY